MRNILKFAMIIIIISTTAIIGQLKEFEIRLEEPPASIPIFPSNPDDAAVIIYSSIANLNFESTTGGIVDIKGDADDGKYILIVRPENQIITVKHRGYREAQIRLMTLESKSVLYYSVQEKTILLTTEKGKFILNSIPQGAEFEVDGLPIKASTPYESDEFRAETYKITIKKNGYETQVIYLTIESGKVISKTVELLPDVFYEDFISSIKSVTSNNEKITNIRFEQDGETIVIYYNLQGDTQKDYKLEFLVRRHEAPDEIYRPTFISGAIGEGKWVGTNKKIVWEVKKDFPSGLGEGEFNVELFMEIESEGLAWYYYVGGAVLIAGGAVAALLSGGSSPTTTPQAETLVDPPSRP